MPQAKCCNNVMERRNRRDGDAHNPQPATWSVDTAAEIRKTRLAALCCSQLVFCVQALPRPFDGTSIGTIARRYGTPHATCSETTRLSREKKQEVHPLQVFTQTL